MCDVQWGRGAATVVEALGCHSRAVEPKPEPEMSLMARAVADGDVRLLGVLLDFNRKRNPELCIEARWRGRADTQDLRHAMNAVSLAYKNGADQVAFLQRFRAHTQYDVVCTVQCIVRNPVLSSIVDG